ncbi:MAG: hypothetical protein HYR88_18900 [Verrucomicrobia bacterium]|nr:hypothetical protein [Verrucomicrobiota bacterium]MBI3869970.1 hypothetical protein [Verrucomicrobiota bacterium]
METSTETPAAPTPRRVRYQMFCLLWSFPSLGACVILARTPPPWREGAGIAETLGNVQLEAWIALALLGAHAAWLWLWRRSPLPDSKDVR